MIHHELKIRPMLKSDRDTVLDIIKRTGMFTDDEHDVALELIDIFLNNEKQHDYIILVAEIENGKIAGYVCYGPTPATLGTYDMYWIAVDPQLQNRRIGKALLLYIEDAIRQKSGKMIIIETSSIDKYHLTRQFYIRNSYTLEASIKDFYRKGDDRQIYVKRLV